MKDKKPEVKSVKVVKTVKNVLLINTCCGSGFGMVRKYQEANPTLEVKVTKVGILNARDQKLHEKYGFDIKSLEGHGHGILIIDEKIVDRC